MVAIAKPTGAIEYNEGGLVTNQDNYTVVITRSSKQPGRWKHGLTSDARGYVPSYAEFIYRSSTVANTFTTTHTDNSGTSSVVSVNEDFSTNISPAAWKPDALTEQNGDAVGSSPGLGEYATSPTDYAISSNKTVMKCTPLDGEFTDIYLYGLYRENNNDQRYGGEDYDLFGLYYNHKNLLIDGNMESDGTGSYSAGNAATLSKETVGTDQVLRVAYNGSSNPYARQTILTSGRTYNVIGSARGDGSKFPVLQCGGSNKWVGTNSTSFQDFDVTFTATATDISLYCVGGSARYTEYSYVLIKDTDSWAPFAANRSCSAYLMQYVLGHNLNKCAYQSRDVWSTTI